MLLGALAKATEWHLADFDTQKLANVAWVFATAGLSRVAVADISRGSEAACERLQSAGARQHSISVCDGRPL